VETAKTDVHSGTGGSIFPNAAWRLVWALRSLKGSDEYINLPGHYDKVRPPFPKRPRADGCLPEIADEYKSRYGVDYFLKDLTGGVELKLAEVFEPTCTICGLTSGYQGPGSKTVLPARASAKVDFRLVPDQHPDDVYLNPYETSWTRKASRTCRSFTMAAFPRPALILMIPSSSWWSKRPAMSTAARWISSHDRRLRAQLCLSSTI
jgi:hypothetical protein